MTEAPVRPVAPGDLARRASLRYLNLFRLFIAALFLFFGRTVIGLGNEAPVFFVVVALAYFVTVLALGFPDAVRRLGFDRLVTVQMVVDIVALVLMMHASGGARGGLPTLLMVLLAGGGLVGQGRWVLFYAALATVAVLTENGVRTLTGHEAPEFFAVGMVCIGFFGVALMARYLASRALANEALAEARGADLVQQRTINERIIEDMPDGVLVLDEDLRVLQFNPQAERLLGRTLGPGGHLVDAVPVLAARLAEAAGEGASGEVIVDDRGTIEYRVVPPVAAGGGTIVYLQDLEEIQAQAQQIKLAALGRLTAGIAHEIRNPLTAVSHAAELLREEKRAEGQIRLTRIINDNAQRIEQLVRDVLSLGRRDRAMLEALPLQAFVRDFLDEFTLHGEAEKAQVSMDIPDGITLAFDRAHLHQILWNLLANARRYASERPGAIAVRASRDDGLTRLEVIDDGPGIAPEHRTQLFEPFFTTHAKGTGLGLYIARELAEANRASLRLLDTERGAHFCLTGPSQP
ncbi:PAS domain-containing protein [Nitrogeniibacter mangrovi]|uniref:histidine kinase n=2 Tax=Nitrogeniibacter mangrovi TaxID=2016596 RepID=A0A6C1BC81_9RHOO|nr:PAS domain-containing protein [Nitrogeniibacter mangrovi]